MTNDIFGQSAEEINPAWIRHSGCDCLDLRHMYIDAQASKLQTVALSMNADIAIHSAGGSGGDILVVHSGNYAVDWKMVSVKAACILALDLNTLAAYRGTKAKCQAAVTCLSLLAPCFWRACFLLLQVYLACW